MQDFKNLKGIIGTTKAMPKAGEVDINTQGLTDGQREDIDRIEKKKRKKEPLTAEEEEQLRRLGEAKKQRANAISILRGISIRMPLLIYGAELTQGMQDVTLANFTEIIDDISWEEFMPKGVTKLVFANFRRYYDRDIFLAAGRRIRALAEAADRMTVEQRIHQIAAIFNAFRNPDKETVLTPWRVVNRHLGDTIGGYCFYNGDYTAELDEPRYIEQAGVTRRVFTPDTHILEINSKSGLYPLYVAYSAYRAKVANALFFTDTVEEQQRIWDEVVRENIFVICKTEMARSITRRTLLGFRYDNAKGGFGNFYVPDDLINRITNEQSKFIEQINKGQTFKHFKNMKFNAIVGNPPYQVMDGGGTGDSAKPIYNMFMDCAKMLQPQFISLIMPSRWMKGGKGLNDFRKKMMEDTSIRYLYDYEDYTEMFPGSHIDGGICYLLWDRDYNGKVSYVFYDMEHEKHISQCYLADACADTVIRDDRQLSIITAAKSDDKFSVNTSARKPYGFCADVFNKPERYPQLTYYDNPAVRRVKLFGVIGNKGGAKRMYKYIDIDKVPKHQDGISKWKLFFSKAYTTTATIPPEIIVAQPNEICSETFIEIGTFNNSILVEIV